MIIMKKWWRWLWKWLKHKPKPVELPPIIKSDKSSKTRGLITTNRKGAEVKRGKSGHVINQKGAFGG